MRLASIDVLRTLAIFLMVIVHFSENLSGVNIGPAGLGAPMFCFLVGMSYRLWVIAQEERQKTSLEISKITIRRGLFLFFLGFMFNVCVWLPQDALNWDVLTMIGVSTLVLNVARQFPLYLSTLVSAIAFICAPLLRLMTNFPSYWTAGYFQSEWTMPDLLIGFFANGYFPFFPWVLYPLWGYIIGEWLFDPIPGQELPLKKIGYTGLGLVIFSVTILLTRSYFPQGVRKYLFTGWTMFPPAIDYVILTFGLVLLLFALCHEFIDRRQKLKAYPGLLKIANTFSKHSLTIYILHHMLHLYPLWLYGIIQGEDATEYWRKAIDFWYAFPGSFVCIYLCYRIARWLERTEKPTIESWMRWLCG